MNAHKAYFVFRTDLDLTPAKLAVQVGHGVDLIWRSSSNNLSAFNAWLAKESGDRRKIVLKLKTLEQLNNLKKTLESDGIQCELIIDSGYTIVEPETITGLVVFPTNTEHKKLKRL
jgi:PTH2 family peptidyl-tRNA hydrolase